MQKTRRVVRSDEDLNVILWCNEFSQISILRSTKDRTLTVRRVRPSLFFANTCGLLVFLILVAFAVSERITVIGSIGCLLLYGVAWCCTVGLLKKQLETAGTGEVVIVDKNKDEVLLCESDVRLTVSDILEIRTLTRWQENPNQNHFYGTGIFSEVSVTVVEGRDVVRYHAFTGNHLQTKRIAKALAVELGKPLKSQS